MDGQDATVMTNEIQEKDSAELRDLLHLAGRLGATDAKVINTAEIVIEDNLARLCVAPQCENYGLSAKCPPNVSGPDGFRKLLQNYRRAIVFKIDVPSEVLFSNDRLEVFGLLHEVAASIELSAIRMGFSESKAFAGSSCKKLFCGDYPRCRVIGEGGECRNPDRARPSMSGFGINVSKLMQAAGWAAISRNSGANGESTGTVCGLVLIS